MTFDRCIVALIISAIALVASCSSATTQTTTGPASDPVVSAEPAAPAGSPATESICQATDMDSRGTTWRDMPESVNESFAAERLQVTEEQVEAGTYGPAICATAFPTMRIRTNLTPIIALAGHGWPCLAYDTSTPQRPDTVTDEVILVCPNV